MRRKPSDNTVISPALAMTIPVIAVLALVVLVVVAPATHVIRLIGLGVVAGLWTFATWYLERRVRMRERGALEHIEVEQERSKQISLATVQALACALEARDRHNFGHVLRVEQYAAAMARKLNVDADGVDGLRVAALLHEIGRLGVPDSILTKSAALTENERGRVESYPVLGARILSSVPFPWPVAPLVLHHREQHDGSGYPDGLIGEAVPLGARIIAVADTYDTLVSARPYRPRHSHDEAIEIIRRLSGIKLDPNVVDALLATVDEVRSAGPADSDDGCGAEGTARDIARAQNEMQSLYCLACEVGGSLNLQTVTAILAQRALDFVSADTSVVFLVDEGDEYLRAIAARGINEAHYTDSLARYGTYLTGRSASRGEVVRTGFLQGDVLLAASDEPWVPLRSTLIAPLVDNGHVIGTINVYHRNPNQFTADDARLLVMVASIAGSAVHNAWLFGHTQESAFTDTVTGLRNSRYMVSFLEQEINRTRKNHRELAVLGIDLDQFKSVNDTLGHARGDEVLAELGSLFKSRVRNYDLVARTGGDEYTVVLPETTREEAEIVAEKLHHAVSRFVEQSGRRFANFPNIGISVGIAMFPRDGEDIDSLLTYADRLMYLEKQTHRKAA